MQKKFSFLEIFFYSFLVLRDIFFLDEVVSYKVFLSFLIFRVEQQNIRLNIYDIFKVMLSVFQVGKESRKVDGVLENFMDYNFSWFFRRVISLFFELDRLFIFSFDSRVSVIFLCFFIFIDFFFGFFSEEVVKEFFLDLDLVKEIVIVLQYKVVSFVVGLMFFVSRKWRFRDYLEVNIDVIRRVVNYIEEFLREFLDFVCRVCGIVCNFIDSNFEVRIKDQLQIIFNFYYILFEIKESLDRCDWFLEVFVIDIV